MEGGAMSSGGAMAEYADEAPRRYKAVVIFFNRQKGFGFLAVKGYPSDLYLHSQDLRRSGVDPEKLLPGTPLLCSIGVHRSRDCAIDLALEDQTVP
jgi:cold shock CspA family protein